MKIEELLSNKGYENNAYKICKFLGLDDTNKLIGAKFFSQEMTYSPIMIPGWTMSNNDRTWHVCCIEKGVLSIDDIDSGYNINLAICDGNGEGKHRYYQDTFLSFLESGLIIPYDENICIKHIKWQDKLTDTVDIVHEADVLFDTINNKILSDVEEVQN